MHEKFRRGHALLFTRISSSMDKCSIDRVITTLAKRMISAEGASHISLGQRPMSANFSLSPRVDLDLDFDNSFGTLR
jgi:hypothetical protein